MEQLSANYGSGVDNRGPLRACLRCGNLGRCCWSFLGDRFRRIRFCQTWFRLGFLAFFEKA